MKTTQIIQLAGWSWKLWWCCAVMEWNRGSVCSASRGGWLLLQFSSWRQPCPQDAVLSHHLSANGQMLLCFCSALQERWNLSPGKEIHHLNLLVLSQGTTLFCKEQGWSFADCRHSHPSSAKTWKEECIFKNIISNTKSGLWFSNWLR